VPVLFFFFVGLFTFAHVAAGKVIVQRAASAGARAAVVFLPDDKVYYEGTGVASKEDCIRQAVKLVLVASPHFKVGDGEFNVEWTPSAPKLWDPTTVTVTATYDCGRFLGYFICGSDKSVTLTSQATLAYQEGPIQAQ